MGRAKELSTIVVLFMCMSVATVFAQTGSWDNCEERYYPMTITGAQDTELLDVHYQTGGFVEEFTKEYALIDLSSPGCEYCVEWAQEVNQNLGFQQYFGTSGSCDFLTLVDEPRLEGWIDVVGSGTFVVEHSFGLTEITTVQFPSLFMSPQLTGYPTYMFVDRSGEVVWRYEGQLPESLIQDYCIVDDPCIEEEEEPEEEEEESQEEESEEEGGEGEGAGTGSGEGGEEGETGGGGGEAGGGGGGGGETGGGSGGGGESGGGNGGGEGGGNGSDNGGGGETGSEPPTGPQGSEGGEGGSGPGDGGQGEGGNGGFDGSIDTTPITPPGIEQEVGRLQIEIPWESERDIVTNESILTTANSKDSVRITWRQVNKRLRLVIGAALLAALVYTGFKFITAAGNAEKTKAALTNLIYVGVALALALFAFLIVRLITNVFVS